MIPSCRYPTDSLAKAEPVLIQSSTHSTLDKHTPLVVSSSIDFNEHIDHSNNTMTLDCTSTSRFSHSGRGGGGESSLIDAMLVLAKVHKTEHYYIKSDPPPQTIGGLLASYAATTGSESNHNFISIQANNALGSCLATDDGIPLAL